jgi:hypothetical protein
MRFSLRKCIAFSVCASLIIICSCEKHHVGELPEVQKERVDLKSGSEATPDAAVSPAPVATPTPAEFFPTKPR